MRPILLFIVLLGWLSGCGPEEYTWNERTTVTVRTPQGIVTGTSVIEYRATYCPDGCGFPPVHQIHWDYTGEATVVEVLPDRYLFVLPQIFLADAHRWAPGVLGEFSNPGERFQNASTLVGPVTVPVDAYPEMLTFLEWENARTLIEIDPIDISESFGDRIEIVAITIEVTSDSASQPIVPELLNWSCEQRTDEDGSLHSFQVQDDSPRGWYSVSNRQFGRPVNLCREN